MTEEEKAFERDAATLEMGERLADYARSLGMLRDGDPASALIAAAMKVLESELGNEHLFPIMKRWLKTITDWENRTTSYN